MHHTKGSFKGVGGEGGGEAPIQNLTPCSRRDAFRLHKLGFQRHDDDVAARKRVDVTSNICCNIADGTCLFFGWLISCYLDTSLCFVVLHCVVRVTQLRNKLYRFTVHNFHAYFTV